MNDRPVNAGRFFLEHMVRFLVNIPRVKMLKNVLLVIALFHVAMPCIHAAEHHHGSPFSDVPDLLSAVHSCECHSCDSDTVCTEPLEVDQTLSLSSADAPAPAPMFQLFVLNHSRSVCAPAAPPVHGPPPGHKMTQLLI